jgi:methylated-DNA-[protein]-cysteine S-methyltransferase
MVTEFQKKVYNICKKIPKGKVTTYRAIAKKIGTKAYRAVGAALNKNPYGISEFKGKDMVPCHRVINSNGFVGGFATGIKNKIELLKKEGIEIKNNKIVKKDIITNI